MGFCASSFLDLRVWLSCGRHIAASGACLAAFPGKSQRVNILDILGHVFFSTPTFSPKAAVDSMQIDKPGCEPKNCTDGYWNVNFRHFVCVCVCLVHVWVYVHGSMHNVYVHVGGSQRSRSVVFCGSPTSVCVCIGSHWIRSSPISWADYPVSWKLPPVAAFPVLGLQACAIAPSFLWSPGEIWTQVLMFVWQALRHLSRPHPLSLPWHTYIHKRGNYSSFMSC